MAGEDRGPLIATFDDGTQIYRNGVLNSRGYFELNIGIYNFSKEFDPNTGEWALNETASFVTNVGNGSIELAPSDEGLAVELSGSISFVDIGIVITEDGEVLPMLGFGVGNDILGVNAGFIIADDNTHLSSYNTITVSPDGTVIKIEHFPGADPYDYVKVKYSIYDANGVLVNEGFTEIGDPDIAARMGAGDPTLRGASQCFGTGTPIDMWPIGLSLEPGPDGVYDQELVQAKIWQKPIEEVKIGDLVVAFDDVSNLVPGHVPRTMTNDVKILLNFHDTRVTPGHVYYRPDSKASYKFETLIDVLRDDGVIQKQDGSLIRAATNVPVGDPRDGFVLAVTGTRRADGGVATKDQGRIRLGTRFIVDGKRSYAVADLIEAGGGVVGEDELIRVGDSAPMPFYWEFGDTLPKPEDFILECSGTTLEDIYKMAEWENQRPHLPAPMVVDGGPVQPLSQAAQAAVARNEPLELDHALANGQPREVVDAKQDGFGLKPAETH